MKRRLFLFLCITFSTFSLYGQNWLEEGQTWEYDVTGGWNPAMYGKMVMRVEGDTTIDGIACKRVIHYQPDGSLETNYAYQDQGRVYCYDTYLETFVKVYDFNLLPGDTIYFYGDRRYVVDSVGTAQIAGADRKFQVVSLTGNSLDEGTYLIAEGLGLLSRTETFDPIYDCIYFFIQYPFCMEAVDGQSYRFRCFTEGEITYDPFGLCTLSATSEPLTGNALHIFPNPAQSEFTVSLEDGGPGILQIFDAAGRLCLQRPFNDLSLPTDIPAAGLHAGNYTVLFTGGKEVWRSRLLILNY